MDSVERVDGVTGTWYRMEDRRVSCASYDGESFWSESAVTVFKYTVERATAQGVWLRPEYGGRSRFVLRDSRKRFACPTVEEAAESFRARKARQFRILRAQIKHIVDALALAAATAPPDPPAV